MTLTKIILALALTSLFSCEKAEVVKSCSCYKQNQEVQVVNNNGQLQVQWVDTYQEPAGKDCDNATDWVDTSTGKRYKVICN